VPGSDEKISYKAIPLDDNNRMSTVLVIYDIVSGTSEIIPIGRGEKDFIGWDHQGKSFYGTDYLITIE